MLKFENVSKVFKSGMKAVDSVNFEIQEGEFIVLIGPSGSGKSTTMRMINRMISHTSGTIYINGKDISSMNPSELRRDIGYVIQQIGLFPHYTIEKNIAIVPELKGWTKEEIKKRVHELLLLVGLDPATFGSRYPKELSGGQQQRVGVARALASNPQVILMDEPFGALDPITREQLQNELLSLQQKLKKTIVFVTHDMDEALKMGDRIAILKDGQLLQLDTPEKLLHDPADGFVRDFIGKDRIIQNPELMPVTGIMTDQFITADLTLSPEKAVLIMNRKKMTSLVIVDDQQSVVGVISSFDLASKLNEINSIEEIMYAPKYILPDSATAKEAIVMMSEVRRGMIPIVDAAGKVKGLVTRETLLAALSSKWTEMEEANE